MQVHFLYRHVLYTLVIMEEGKLPHPQCPHCDMLVPRRALNYGHPATSHCARGAERKRWRLAEAGLRERLERSFEAYEEPLQHVKVFKYLGRVLTTGNYEWLSMVGNLGKARKRWGRISQILIREGADPKVSGHFGKVVLQLVFLFGAETWVLTPRIERALDIF